MFVPNLVGTLMKIEEDPVTRYHYEVWFDYTRKVINTIGEGAMLAVPNFAGNDHEIHYSILEVTGILPMHYALGNDTSGYPGFVVEAAHNAGRDWTDQDNISTEDTTKIRCIAIPTNLEIVESPFAKDGRAPKVQEEGNVPMVGHQACLLDTSMTEHVANLNIDLEHDDAIQIGTLVRDPNVRAYLRVEELIKVHFGIFGFTGAGKSNLLSTLVRKLLNETKDHVKIVIFDLMSEYTGLLLDELVMLPKAYIVNIGAQTTPESVLEYYAQPNQEQLKKATIDYTNATVLPKALKRRQAELHRPIAMLLHDRKIVFWQSRQQTAGEVIQSNRNDVLKGNLGNWVSDLNKLIKELIDEFRETALDSDSLAKINARIESFQATPKLPATAFKNLDNLKDSLQSTSNQTQTEIPVSARITIPQIIDVMNDDSGNALLIIQSHHPDDLREFASTLGNLSYERRRRSGKITPLVSFVFDEADEFIPGQPTDSQKMSRAVAMTLARRGRKFGLGIGIATQRIRYLDTSILAQPHTYFVSKLPRLTDRQAIAEAFGISEDMFRQTFKFKKGDWLLASYDAAGLEAIPIPIHTENADERILSFVEKMAKEKNH